MISIAQIGQGVNVVVFASLLALLALFFSPAAVLAVTATPNYDCGNYGRNTYGSCDTIISDDTSTGGGTTGTGTGGTGGTGTTTDPTTPTTTDPSTPTTPTPDDSTDGEEEAEVKNNRWLLIFSFLIFLLGLLLFLWLLFKRRKRKDDEQPPYVPPQTPQPPVQPTLYQ